MIIIGILGDIGSGKSLLAKQFGYPVFNADEEVTKIYKEDKSCFNKLNKILPNYIKTKPIKKKELSRAILENKSNLKKIVKIVHPLVRKRMRKFFKKNYKRKMVIIDVPLLIENKLHNKNLISRESFDIVGDFSSASFIIVAALISPESEVIIKNVGLNPTRNGLLKVLALMGADIEIKNVKNICNEESGDI